jgi:vacuolar-type H+-ATPase subunit I/STV1
MDDPNLVAAISLVLGFAFSVAGMLRIVERSHRPRGAILGAMCVLMGLCLTIVGSLLFIVSEPLNGAAPQTADPSAPAATRSARLRTR